MTNGLKEKKFKLNTRSNFLVVRTLKWWNSLPRIMVCFPYFNFEKAI